MQFYSNKTSVIEVVSCPVTAGNRVAKHHCTLLSRFQQQTQEPV